MSTIFNASYRIFSQNLTGNSKIKVGGLSIIMLETHLEIYSFYNLQSITFLDRAVLPVGVFRDLKRVEMNN